MALQHFYSRVPARISIFNRADSFDTFAMSEGLDKEFIDRELGGICEIKLTTKDAELVRRGLVAPTYYQTTTKDGKLIQSKITYVPQDYTGERSSYFVHDLVYSNEETDKILKSRDKFLFEKEMFLDDISKFNFADESTNAILNFPETTFNPKDAEDPAWIISELGKDNIIRFIYAVLVIFTGRVKSVFFTFEKPDSESSEYALRFLNAFLQIMPYHLRSGLSFITRLSDTAKMTNVKLKCLAEGTPEEKGMRGATMNFKKNYLSKVSDQEIMDNKELVEFFYQLISNQSLRNEFLMFCDRAVTTEPAIGKYNLKNIQDLVFMFKVCSGFYQEKQVLPDDNKVLEFFLIYDKYRNALTEEHRMNAVKCLKRYPEEHTEIPRQVFSKLSKDYPTEPQCVKQVIMSVVLELIHTDIMRDKLFKFITENYVNESPEIKQDIIMHVSRVFYGGFLQSKIVDFFAGIYDGETEVSKDEIVSKLLLAVRTVDVQDKILYFIDKNYDTFSDKSKENFYKAVLENLKDGDELSIKLFNIAEKNIDKEGDNFKRIFLSGVSELVEKEQKKKEHPLLALIAADNSGMFKPITDSIIQGNPNKKIFDDYIRLLMDGNLQKKTDAIKSVLKMAPKMEAKALEKFQTIVQEEFAKVKTKSDIIALIDFDEQMKNEISLISDKAGEFAKFFSDNIIQNMMQTSILTVFSHSGDDAVYRLLKYAKNHTDIVSAQGFDAVINYAQLENAIKQRNIYSMILASDKLPEDSRFRGMIANYITNNMNSIVTNTELLPVESQIKTDELAVFGEGDLQMFDIALKADVNYIGIGKLDLMSVYKAIVPSIQANTAPQKKKLFAKPELSETQKLAVKFAKFTGFLGMLKTEGKVSEKLGESAEDNNSGILQVITAANEGLGKREVALLNAEIKKTKA